MIQKISYSISPKNKTEINDDINSKFNTNIKSTSQNKSPNSFTSKPFLAQTNIEITLEPKRLKENINSLPTVNESTKPAKPLFCTPVKKFNRVDLITTKPTLTSEESKNHKSAHKRIKEYEEDKAESQLKEEESLEGKSDYEKLIHFQMLNLPIPISKADDEKFKLIKMQQMKKKSIAPFKSEKKPKDLKPNYQSKLDSLTEYVHLKRKKIVHSVMKTYASFLTLYSNDKQVCFPIFIDKEIGIYEYWQEHIVDSKADEDNLSDPEQIKSGCAFSIKEIRNAIEILQEKGIQELGNYKYLKAK